MHPNVLLDAATELVRRVLLLDHAADAVVSRFFREHRALGQRDRATLAETAYAVLRRKPYFEHLARSGRGARERRLALLAFAAPRDFVKQAIDPAERAWLDACDAVAATQLLPQHRHNLPAWIAERLTQSLGPREFERLATALLEPAPLDLRVNTLLQKREQAAQALRALGAENVPTPYSPWGLRLAGKPALQRMEPFTQGAVEVQDEGSQLLALITDARRGEMVADFCAGAGGKTLALGAAMRNTGRLYAFDVAAHRLEALKGRLARSTLSNVHPVAIAHERDERLKRLAGRFDRVLVDAPCSGLGTLRRNPDLKWRQSAADVAEMALKQAAILRAAARLVRPGGRLVYATCSLLAEENEDIALAFGAAHPDFTPENAAALLAQLKVADAAALCAPGQAAAGRPDGAEAANGRGAEEAAPAPRGEGDAPERGDGAIATADGSAASAAMPGADDGSAGDDSGAERPAGADAHVDPRLPAAVAAGQFLRLWPHRHATDGFFAAVWTRRP